MQETRILLPIMCANEMPVETYYISVYNNSSSVRLILNTECKHNTVPNKCVCVRGSILVVKKKKKKVELQNVTSA